MLWPARNVAVRLSDVAGMTTPPYRPQHTGPHTGPHTYRAQHPAPQPYPHTYPQQWPITATPHVIRADRNGLGTAGLVLGIVSLCFAVIPVVGLVAWVLWPLGAIFSGVGLGRANAATATNRNSALAGLITSGVAALVCVGWVAFTVYTSTTGGR